MEYTGRCLGGNPLIPRYQSQVEAILTTYKRWSSPRYVRNVYVLDRLTGERVALCAHQQHHYSAAVAHRCAKALLRGFLNEH